MLKWIKAGLNVDSLRIICGSSLELKSETWRAKCCEGFFLKIKGLKVLKVPIFLMIFRWIDGGFLN